MKSPSSIKPRRLWQVLVFAQFFFTFLGTSCELLGQQKGDVNVWFGTANNNCGMQQGIYRAKLSMESKSISSAEMIHSLPGAGWVCTSDKGMMYCTGNIGGKHVVVSFDPDDSNATLQHQEIGDGASCFVTTDRSGKMLISAQYGGGSVAVFPIDENGQLMKRSQLLEHQGGSRVVGNRQNSPHPHYVAVSPDNRFAFVPDLGLDKLVVYRVDAEQNKLTEFGTVDVEPGGGPRHMKFHPSGKFAFVLNELSLSVTVFAYEPVSGVMKKLATVPALTESEKKMNSFNSASEIRVHPDGKMVVTANRGHDSLSVFEFDQLSGKLTRTDLEPIRGSWPRNFSFSPGGSLLLAAGKDSNSISLFLTDSDKGTITYLQHKSAMVPAPICVLIQPDSE